ncbi:MAG: hypothetical protein J6O39_03380 [Treponema sp.]|nr:hypothetical protein [Treponema sp.]
MAAFRRFIKKYRDNYCISPQDLEDFAETNRIHLLIITPILFLFGILDFLAIILIHHSKLEEQVFSLIYFGGFTLVAFYSYVCSKYQRKKERKRIIHKNIPKIYPKW